MSQEEAIIIHPKIKIELNEAEEYSQIDTLKGSIFIGSEHARTFKNKWNWIIQIGNPGETYSEIIDSNISIYSIEFLDNRKINIIDKINECIPIIYNNLEKLGSGLIHCREGRSRSVAILVGFLMYDMKISYDDALRTIQEKRQIAKPNIGFERQLRNSSWTDFKLDKIDFMPNNFIGVRT